MNSKIDYTVISSLALTYMITYDEYDMLYNDYIRVNISDVSCILDPEILGNYWEKNVAQWNVAMAFSSRNANDC